MPDPNYTIPSLDDDSDHALLFKAAYALWLLEQSGGGGGGTPGGADGEVQYNGSGAFAGSPDFKFFPGAQPRIELGQSGGPGGLLFLGGDTGGANGLIQMQQGLGGFVASLSPMGLLTADRQFGFPDETGTLALQRTGSVIQIVAVSPKTDTASGNNNPPTWSAVYSGGIDTKVENSTVICYCCTQVGVNPSFQAYVRLERSGTPLVQGDAASLRIQTFGGARSDGSAREMENVTLIASDIPGAVGNYVYDLGICVESGGNWYLNRSQSDADGNYIARGATTMFLVEIAP